MVIAVFTELRRRIDKENLNKDRKYTQVPNKSHTTEEYSN